jgi:hypothetical protein
MKKHLEKIMKYYSKNYFLATFILLFILMISLFYLYNNIKTNKKNIENLTNNDNYQPTRPPGADHVKNMGSNVKIKKKNKAMGKFSKKIDAKKFGNKAMDQN